MEQKEVSVAFSQLRNGYQASETISAKITYGKLFDPSPDDSIVIIPAGYLRVYEYPAVLAAPMRPKTSVTVKIENADDTESLFPVMPRIRQLRIIESAAKRRAVTVTVTFKNHKQTI
uniref:MSP domain-containing protein n=1 Tax=Panagrellus redivivus TaxID=6233 RepID=A0A7E4VJA0_PANRE